MVQLSDYQQGAITDQVFGGHTSPETLDNLNKALSAGSTTGRETTNLTTASGAPLKVESLEKTLKVLTYSEKDVTFWKDIPKSAAFNTVEEYNQLTDYGQDRGGFNNEGETPVEEDSTYVRRAQLVKFMGVVKGVTHPMTLVNTMIGSAIDREIKNGTMWILRKLDRALFTGNEAIIPQEFNGLYTQHQNNDAFSSLQAYMSSEVVIDARGLPLTEQMIENGANGIVENFGLGTDLYAPPRVLSDFVKNFYGSKFIQPNTEALRNGTMGQKVKDFESQFGNIKLNWDIFQNPPTARTTAMGATSANAPNVIVPDATTPIAAVAATVTNSLWSASDAGTYFYAVGAVNRYGESALTVCGASITVVANGAIDLKFASGGGTFAATGYTIYRGVKGAANNAAAKYYPIFTVTTAQLAAGYDGAAALAVRDLDRWLPDTYQAMLVQKDNEIIEFKQLAPLMKMDLAITSPAFKFMILLYGTPFLYAPKKLVRFINVGKAA